MRYTRLFPLFALLACSCTEEKNQEPKAAFDNFVFSFQGHSMKFTQRDTVFMRRRNVPLNELLHSVISKEDKSTINRFIDSISSVNYDSLYIEQHLHDGSEYKFYITNGKAITSIYLYGQKGPRELYSFATWLVHLEHRYKFQPINANINFGNLDRVMLHPLPPFTIPKHKKLRQGY